MQDILNLTRYLESNASRFDFFQAVRLIECANPDKPRIGESLRPKDDAVRFGQDADLAFQAAAITRYERETGDRPQRLQVGFMGLLGPNGPMPIHITEYVRDRKRNSADLTLGSFVDIFHHRMVSLFYRAWSSAQPTVSLDRKETDRFSNYVGSMFGMGEAALRDRDALPDFAKLHYAGLLANQTRHPAGLSTILLGFFKLPVTVEEFVGHWMDLPVETRSRLGALDGSGMLGVSTVLGEKVWDRQHKFRIVIGPLSWNDFQRMLPGGDSLKRLVAWVRNYVGLTLDWDVRLILKEQEVPELRLGGQSRLGWGTWVGMRKAGVNATDMLINPNALPGSL